MELLATLAVLYHLIAFLGSAIGVFHALGRYRGLATPLQLVQPMIKWGELHLWISGILIIGLGVAMKGMPYFDNPKLWVKVILIVVWSINAFLIRRRTLPNTNTVRALQFGLSLSALIYGTFLGVAKPLAYGFAPFWSLLAGYLICQALAILYMYLLLRRSGPVPASAPR